MKITVFKFLLLIFGYSQLSKVDGYTFQNPILDEIVRFPSIYKHEGSYFMALAVGNRIDLLKSRLLHNFRDAERREIYRVPPSSRNTHAPRIHFIGGDLYIYFALDNITETNDSHRMHVIKNLDPCNPLRNWSNETRLLPEEDIMAHKGTVLEYSNGDLYFIWAGPVAGGANHNLFIARMETPMKVVGPGTLLRAPKSTWEYRVNEAATILRHHGATFLVFSVASLGKPTYCLGIMGIDGGRDPMLPSNWWNDVDHCVFAQNEKENVFGTGYASFINSPDDSETWMAYQAWDCPGKRTVRIQKMEWGEMNNPKFPVALGLHDRLELPSGE